jgi:hypothetical protein
VTSLERNNLVVFYYLKASDFRPGSKIRFKMSAFIIVWFMVFIPTFNNISVISWLSVLLVEETRVSRENHWPVASHWRTYMFDFQLKVISESFDGQRYNSVIWHHPPVTLYNLVDFFFLYISGRPSLLKTYKVVHSNPAHVLNTLCDKACQ